MKLRTAVVLGFTLAVTIATAAPQGAPAAASRQDADSLARKITQITQRGAQGPASGARRTEVSEDEINSWFVFRGRPYLPEGVSNPAVTMIGDGTMRGVATVDLEALGKQRSKGRGMLDLWSYLGGKVPVAVTGTLRARDGRGQFVMKAAEVAGVPVPKALVQELLSIYTASPDQKKPIGLESSFELPARIQSIDVGRGQLVVVQ
jgi:hypothetical protein